MISHTIEPIGIIKTCFPEKFGIPRQPLLVPSAKGMLVLNTPFNDPDFVSGLENVSHIWLTFIFHQHVNKGWKPKVRPPRLGGNEKMGVFATRSSFRPNHLGLSVVKLDAISNENQQLYLHLSGVDLLDGTPIVDIKPYVPYVDSLPAARNSFAQEKPIVMPVHFSLQAQDFCIQYAVKTQVDVKQLIVEVLQQDPRPAYHATDAGRETGRVYGISLLDCNIRWQCLPESEGIVVINIECSG
ncbi:MAG: tRNA-Thr(GGU) m(6)t(6)A37 methyltransferase TsaA [Kiritimatiellia bacterium]|jgi:tRNA-Thr(GGU) m(6)t(6)A37 methyltransferase TsaA